MNKMLPKVIVLLSTYNGEKFIKEQLDSILNQTYSNMKIFVRDDGSTDKTKTILEKYQKEGKIELIEGTNLGFWRSFFELLQKAPEADYYAFCDQDDVWEPEKIEKAIHVLQEHENKDIPILYYSNYDLYDEHMQLIGHPKSRRNTNFENALVECVNLGMTSVINQKVKEILIRHLPEKTLGHDWWIYLICISFGKVYYDESVTAKHRIHSCNTSRQDYRKRKRKIEALTNNTHFPRMRRQIEEFYHCFYQDLNAKQKRSIDLFIKPTFVNQLKKNFFPKKWMNLWKEEIELRIGFLLGMI